MPVSAFDIMRCWCPAYPETAVGQAMAGAIVSPEAAIAASKVLSGARVPAGDLDGAGGGLLYALTLTEFTLTC